MTSIHSGNVPSVSPLDHLLGGDHFRFAHLAIEGIDNELVFARNAPGQREEEICLFHKSMPSGDAYMALLADRIEAGMKNHSPLPVVRFADGEYAFYSGSLRCNGLYRQAESVAAIKAAFPAHVEALRNLAASGIMAPLVFPGNTRARRGLRALLRKKDGKDLATRFLQFLAHNHVKLTETNYIPFYCVYSYLSSTRFALAVHRKIVCIVNSDFNEAACAAWFERAGSHPRLVHVPIPDSYVATQWDSMREDVFRNVPENPGCFMVGAGIGALQVCVDAARRFSAPAIDLGHILNMMNDLERKSQGPRLFTFRR
ncbi:MAG: hypothetical protein COZ05_18945 [Armatimonadetes bacterium CG_4_10_14_3_um_filter_59_10]|nr:MAG: hypothetical protein COZ05_18945 [Armatimonadetes bacterium CG_4_10_14_3_um_filter_59_10]